MDYLALRKQSVVVANDIIQKGRFNLSAKELKIIFYLLAQISPDDTELPQCEIDLQNFCKMCGVSAGGQQRKELEASLLRLEHPWKIVHPNNPHRTVSLAWSRGFDLVTEGRNKGTLVITLDQRLKPFLIQLRSNFTQWELLYTMAFKSKYSIRLYLLIKSIHYKDLEAYSREIPISQLRTQMDAEIYDNFRDFHSRALKPAVQEINLYSDKNLSYELIKQGRTVVAVRFTIRTKDAMERLKVVDQIEQELGTDQLTLWEQLQEEGEPV